MAISAIRLISSITARRNTIAGMLPAHKPHRLQASARASTACRRSCIKICADIFHREKGPAHRPALPRNATYQASSRVISRSTADGHQLLPAEGMLF